ncbi:type III-B CRISPR-associated protein Cas10/Cmr2 [Spirochaeta dissipatitropha]
MSDKNLILISVGPVQDFIAAARKLRDLWFGSTMLSEISKCVARSMYKQGCTLIFPAVENDQDSAEGYIDKLVEFSEFIVANKILVIADADKDPGALLLNAEKEYKDFFAKIATETIESMSKMFPHIPIAKDIFFAQVRDSGEFYGVWVPIGDNYVQARRAAEQLLGARKNLRNFRVPEWQGAGLKKSSLDGARETVLIRRDAAVAVPGLLKRGEELDAIGCIKRFYTIGDSQLNKHFNDLSDIAIIPWLEKIEQDAALKSLHTNLVQSYNEHIEDSNNQKPDRFWNSEYYFVEKFDIKEEPKDEVKSFYKDLDSLRHPKEAGFPPKYACILVGDGDRMGSLISEIDSVEGHQEFSKKLSEFATEVGKSINQFGGSLIYAGGDDVMAYLPLHNALECADRLRIDFYNIMKDVVDLLKLNCDVPTFSAGIAIVHHSAPLYSALEMAREAEGIAKNEGDRNSIAIIQSKRSGSPLKIYAKWQSPNGDVFSARVMKIAGSYNSSESGLSVSTRLAYQLRQIRLECEDLLSFSVQAVDGKKRLIPKNPASALVLRLFRQKELSDLLIEELLLPAQSISHLSNEMVLAKQISTVLYKRVNI